MQLDKITEDKIREQCRSYEFQNFMFEMLVGNSRDENGELFKHVYNCELEETENELIYIGKPLEFDEVHFLSELRKLEQAAIDERFDVKEIVSGIVPTYHIREEDKERDSAIYQEFCKLGRASHEGPVMEE